MNLSRAGFVLYVGVPDDGTPAAEIVDAAETLRELAQEALPTARTLTTLALRADPDSDVQAVGDRLDRLDDDER